MPPPAVAGRDSGDGASRALPLPVSGGTAAAAAVAVGQAAGCAPLAKSPSEKASRMRSSSSLPPNQLLLSSGGPADACPCDKAADDAADAADTFRALAAAPAPGANSCAADSGGSGGREDAA